MKKFLSIFLILLLVLGVTNFCLATENIDENIDENPDGLQTATTLEENGENEEVGEEQEEGENITTEEQFNGVVLAKIIEIGDVQEEIISEDSYDYFYGFRKVKSQLVKYQVIDSGKNKDKVFEIMVYKEFEVAKLDDEGKTQLDAKGNEIIEIEKGDITNYKVGQKSYLLIDNSQGQSQVKPISTKIDIIVFLFCIIALAVLALLLKIKGLKIIALVILDSLIVFGGVINIFSLSIVALIILSIALIVINTLIINGFNKESMVSLISVTISTVFTIGILFGVEYLLSYTGANQLQMTTLDFIRGNAETKETIKATYMQIINLSTIISAIGIAIDTSLKTCKEARKDKKILSIFNDISEKLIGTISIVFMTWLGMFIFSYLTTLSSFMENSINMPIINYEAIGYEVIKLAIIIVSVLLVVPVTAIISKEIIYKNKVIENGKKEE